MRVSALLLVLLAASLAQVAAAANTLEPNVDTLNLVVGTAGSSIRIQYTGTLDPPPGTAYCRIEDVDLVADYGLRPTVEDKGCLVGRQSLWIRIGFEGAYNGEEGEYRPVSTVTVAFYDANDNLIDTHYYSADPITVKPIELTVTVSSVNTNTLSYTVHPEEPEIGAPVRIHTVGEVTLSIQLSSPPDVATTLILHISQPTGYTYTSTVNIPEDEIAVQATFMADVSAGTATYTLKSADGGLIIAQGEVEIPAAGEADFVSLILQPPLEVGEGLGGKILNAMFYVSQITSGALTVMVTVNGVAENSLVVTEPGVYNFEVIVPKDTEYLSGRYMVEYNGRYGTITFEVPFYGESSRGIATGTLVKTVFNMTFLVIVVASAMATTLGFFLRRPDLITGGLLGMSSAVLVFMIPTLIAYVITLLIQSGLHAPEELDYTGIAMHNLGDKVAGAIDWTSRKAAYYAANLRLIAGIILAIIGLLAVASGIGGFIGIITGGALSQFLGRVLGELGSQLVIISLYSYFASYFLDVLAYIYPIVINTILVAMFFVILVQALFAAYTGNIAQVYQPVIQFSLLVLMVLLVPLILESVDYIQDNVKAIPMPEPINRVVESIPNPFFWIAAAIFKIVLLASVMYMAFNRLVAVLSGGQA